MGQKVHPNGIRLGIVKPWNSTWFANTKEFADNLDSDFKVRQFLTKELAKASVSRIVIERPATICSSDVWTAVEACGEAAGANPGCLVVVMVFSVPLFISATLTIDPLVRAVIKHSA